ncbi:MAG: DUF1588 domain-containing protein [Lentisphaeraceae bacterium]|nr:DUF1588 domain-containing protein [Lentisphaeraceae bacterium]
MKKISIILLTIFSVFSTYAFEKPKSELLEKFCYDCHSDGVDKGGFEFDQLMKLPENDPRVQKTWHKIWEVIEKQQMPPTDKKKQPTQAEREEMMISVEKSIFDVHRDKEYAGKIKFMRLSNEQFGNAIDEVVGFPFKLGHKMPLDATSAGYANNGNTMNISPLLFERYQDVTFRVAFELFNKKSTNRKAVKRGDRWLAESGHGKDAVKLKETLTKLITKAYRRPATDEEISSVVNHYDKYVKNDFSHREAMEQVFKSVLTSPSFILRTELFGTDQAKGNLARLDEYALASRLSFFIWNSSPDERLMDLASKNQLRANLDSEIKRMIDNKKIENMIESFGMYWLGIQYVENKQFVKKYKYRSMYKVQMAMRKETGLFLQYIFQDNKPINDLLTSRETFVNGRLGEIYKLDVKMSEASLEAQRLSLPDPDANVFYKVTTPEKNMRRGILSMPSVLMATSNPDHTSPVNRGMWVLETVLGMPPPPAPNDVDPIKEEDLEAAKEQKLSFRQVLEKHRDNKKCASCHAMMDPLGFAYENFAPNGKWRTKDQGAPVDSKTNWRGDDINGFVDLADLLVTKYRPHFVKTLTENMMTYSLGRALDYEDRISIMNIVKIMNDEDSKIQDLVKAIVQSTPFQYRELGGDK